MGAVNALPPSQLQPDPQASRGWVTVGAGSDVGAGLAEVRERGSVLPPPAELGALGSQPQAQELCTLPGQHTSHRGWGKRWREVVFLVFVVRGTSRSSNWTTAGNPDSPPVQVGERDTDPQC